MNYAELEIKVLGHLHQLAGKVCSEPGCENRAKEGFPLCVQHLAGPVSLASEEEIRAKRLLEDLLSETIQQDIRRAL